MSPISIRRETLSIPDGGELIPALLQLPRSGVPMPGVLLLHGFSSRKERMADTIGRALAQRGVAALSVDLPLHGAREEGIEGLSLRNPLALVQKWTLAVREANAAIEYLRNRSDVDPTRIGIGGYSLGAYLGIIVASRNNHVDALALAAGGDLPANTPFSAIVRSIADPARAARAFAGRPLLMVNGRYDRTIRPEQARALFEAAGEPKELVWYDGGHWPPQVAIEQVAEWLVLRLSKSAARQLGKLGRKLSSRAAEQPSSRAAE
ncbi:MAG TPA: alpha/beta fold hydrolase [Gemmatimonadaceae bacterium]|nr:alpha/beta fold hydrolase [Gemmatimonadaceae bacterium]